MANPSSQVGTDPEVGPEEWCAVMEASVILWNLSSGHANHTKVDEHIRALRQICYDRAWIYKQRNRGQEPEYRLYDLPLTNEQIIHWENNRRMVMSEVARLNQ